MCGIVGAVDLHGDPIDAPHVERMASCQRHRGPDHQGRFRAPGVDLACQRLAIIDLTTGDQPIFNEDRTLVVVYNGELYNYRELRQALVRDGHRFSSASDTEVLVHAYEQYGLDFLTRLNGMFAFALWDTPRRRLVLARDHVGMKPLYYTTVGQTLWFASEVKTLLTVPGVTMAVEPEALAEYLTYQNLFGRRSLFTGIHKVEAGHYLCVENGTVAKHRYWDVSFDGAPRQRSLSENLAEYRAQCEAAVERHLISDVAVGGYLSGGFDSTAVTLLSARKLESGFHAFTGAFEEHPYFDERPPARATARQSGAQLHEITIRANDFWDSLETVSYAMDEPSVGSGAIPQYLVAREAARFVKVVLTGHGGDELLLGYEAYKAVLLRDRLSDSPTGALGLLASVRRSELPRVLYFLLTRDPIRRAGLVRLFARADVLLLLAPRLRQQLAAYDPYQALHEVLAPLGRATGIEQAMYLYLKTYLPTLLVQEDKVGMAHSIESRMPLCDRQLVEFLSAVPADQRMHGGELKYFPKHGLRDLYPPEILQQPKRGFPTPIARWFKGPLRSQVEARLFRHDAPHADLFDMPALRGLWDRFLRTAGDGLMGYYLANQVYSLLSVCVWFDVFIARKLQTADGFRSAPAGRI